MRTRSRLALWTAAAPLAVAALFITTPVANADSSASTKGARATFAAVNEVFRLYDTRCDSSPVYLKYTVNGGSEKRLDYSGGCNTNATYDLSFAEGATIRYKACVNIRLSPDRCSGWTSDVA